MHTSLLITSATEGERLLIAGSVYRIILSGQETGGKTAIIEMNVPPGSGPVPHEHPGFQESFYVLEGEVQMRTKTQNTILGQGAIITIPLNGPIHSFKNISDKPARLLCMVSPAGLDDFFREAGKPATGDAKPQPLTEEEKQSLRLLADKYGQKLYPPDYFEQ
jgi:quercetin dioxygenase-like cupin family protein